MMPPELPPAAPCPDTGRWMISPRPRWLGPGAGERPDGGESQDALRASEVLGEHEHGKKALSTNNSKNSNNKEEKKFSSEVGEVCGRSAVGRGSEGT